MCSVTDPWVKSRPGLVRSTGCPVTGFPATGFPATGFLLKRVIGSFAVVLSDLGHLCLLGGIGHL